MNYDQLESKIQGLNIPHFNSLIRAYKNGIGLAFTIEDGFRVRQKKMCTYEDFLYQALAYLVNHPEDSNRQALIDILEEELALDKLNRLNDIKLKLEKAKAPKPQSSTAAVLCTIRIVKLNYAVPFANPASEKPPISVNAKSIPSRPAEKMENQSSKKQYSFVGFIKNFIGFFAKAKSQHTRSSMISLQPVA